MTTNNQTELVPAKTIEARWGITPDELRRAVGPHIINPTDDSDPFLRYLQEVGLNTKNWPGDYPRGSYVASTTVVAKRLNILGQGKNPGDRIVRLRNKAVRDGYLTIITPASGRRPATVALSFDFMTNHHTPTANNPTTRDRLARIINELTNLHNQLPN